MTTIWRELINQKKKVYAVFDDDIRYRNAGPGKRIRTEELAAILKSKWRISNIDADFFAKRISELQQGVG